MQNANLKNQNDNIKLKIFHFDLSLCILTFDF